MSTVPKIVIKFSVKIRDFLFSEIENNPQDLYLKINNCQYTFVKNLREILQEDDFSKHLVGTIMYKGNDGEVNKEECANKYINYFINYEIKKPNAGKSAPEQFNASLNEYRINKIEPPKVIFPINFWRLVEMNATGEENNKFNIEILDNKDNKKEKTPKLPQKLTFLAMLINLVSTINRHYGELFSLGLYPPHFLEKINVSQAKKLNNIINLAKEKAEKEGKNDPNDWRDYFEKSWEEKSKTSGRLGIIGDTAYKDYQSLLTNEIIQIILGFKLAHETEISIDEVPEKELLVHDDLLREDYYEEIEPEDFDIIDVLISYRAKLIEVCEKDKKDPQGILNNKLNDKEKEIIFRILDAQSILDLLDDDKNGDIVLDRMRGIFMEIAEKYLDAF